MHFVRRELGVEAFGINWFEIPPNAEGLEHDEQRRSRRRSTSIVRGSGIYRIDGEEVPVREGTSSASIRGRPAVPVAGPEG